MQTLSLFQLNTMLRDAVEQAFPQTVWVMGELCEGRQAGNGHFYGELIEKAEDGYSVRARARLTCWARTYNLLRLRFVQESGQDFRAGINVMLLVQVTFHEAFGLSLNILDIDVSYTLGDLVQRRRKILEQLDADGILQDNQTLPMPTLAQRVAVVSAAGAAGYGDFCHHLLHNDHHLRFSVQLFPAVMQGEHVEDSVLAALSAIAEEDEAWDVVVLIRGGGATADLSHFDSYALGACIAQFPLPVIVGIGHERDQTVPDYVAHKRVKTPTAAADFIIEHQFRQLQLLTQYSAAIRSAMRETLAQQQNRLQRIAMRFPASVQSQKFLSQHRLAILSQRMRTGVRLTLRQAAQQTDSTSDRLLPAMRMLVERQRHQLTLYSRLLEQADPGRLLRMGYSITTVGGKVVTNAAQVRPGDVVRTQLAQGELLSVCQQNIKEQTHAKEDDL